MPRPKSQNAINDLQRQANIKESHNRDDFSISQFDSIDWLNPDTYGPDCVGMCVQPTKNPIPNHLLIPGMGITQDNYYIVSIKGDGSCWMRSAIQALLYQAFLNTKNFNTLIANITKVKTNYADVVGFNERFRSEDLIKLLTTLRKLSPQERLAQFNKINVDLFLDYSMRALLHAYSSKKINYSGQDGYREKELQEILRSHSWGDASITVRALANELLAYEPMFASFANVFVGDQSGYMYFLRRGGISADVIGEDGVGAYNQILATDHRSLATIRSEIDALKRANMPVPRKNYQALLAKELQDAWGISSFAELHAKPPFAVLPMLQTDNHYAVMVHKDAAEAFGYK